MEQSTPKQTIYGSENELHSEPDMHHFEYVTLLGQKLHHKKEVTGNVQRSRDHG